MPELFDILDLAAMRLKDGPVNRTYANGVVSIIDVWDDIVVQGKNISANTVTNSMTVNKSGLYEVGIMLNVAFQGNDELAVYAYVNGIQDPSGFLALQGEGNGKPIALYWEPLVRIEVGQVLDIRGTNRDSGSFDCEFINAQLRLKYSAD